MVLGENSVCICYFCIILVVMSLLSGGGIDCSVWLIFSRGFLILVAKSQLLDRQSISLAKGILAPESILE